MFLGERADITEGDEFEIELRLANFREFASLISSQNLPTESAARALSIRNLRQVLGETEKAQVTV